MLDRSSKILILLGMAATAVAALTLRAAASSPSSSPNISGKESTPLLGRKCLILGDSLAVGLGPRLRQVAEKAGCKATVDAQVSTTTGHWAGGPFQASLAKVKPDFVLVSLGTNDAALRDPERSKPRIQILVDAAKKAGVRLYWVGPPGLPARLRGADAIRAMIRATGVPYFESEKVTFQRSQDGVHATRAGYAAWAEAVWAWVLEQEKAREKAR